MVNHRMANGSVLILLMSIRRCTSTQCIAHPALAYSCNDNFIYSCILVLWFSPCCFIGPTSFNVTAEVVFLSSILEQINVNWTVSCTAKGLSVNRHFRNTSMFIPLNSVPFYDTRYSAVYVLMPSLDIRVYIVLQSVIDDECEHKKFQ